MITVSATAQPTPVSSFRRLIANHPLISFFALAFAGSWLAELPVLLGQDGFGVLAIKPEMDPLFILMPFLGPTLAAFLVTAFIDGKAGVRHLLRRYIQWREGVRWYLLALFGPPIVLFIGAVLFFGATPMIGLLAHPSLLASSYLAIVPLVLVIGGPLGEEPGWRGFALPRLQQRFRPLTATLILGLLHGIWHVPLFFVVGGHAPFTFVGFAAFILTLIVNAIIWTWVFNNVRQSLLIMFLLHAAVNASGGFISQLIPSSPYLDWLPIIALGLCALLVIIGTHARLGYNTPTPVARE